jgi:hypothetical protein
VIRRRDLRAAKDTAGTVQVLIADDRVSTPLTSKGCS